MSRFGGLHRAYELIGWSDRRDSSFIEANRELRRRHQDLVQIIVADLRATGAHVEMDDRSDLMTINHEYTASLILSRCQETKAQSQRWRLRFDAGLVPDITIAARLNPGNQTVKDYYLLPGIDLLWKRLSLAADNGVSLDLYRFDTLSLFINLAKRTSRGGCSLNEQQVESIPISEIRIINPRSRNRIKWQLVVQSIATIGLKRPITVAQRPQSTSDGKRYDLVCGQGTNGGFCRAW